jgi:hypothetical protein
VDHFLTVSDSNLPAGCSVVVHSNSSTTVYWNRLAESPAPCGTLQGGGATVGSFNAEAASVSVTIRLDTSVPGGLAPLTLSGPAGSWYGVGLNSPNYDMADEPYTIVVDGTGNVSERKIGKHAPGTLLKQSLSLVSNTVADGRRQVVVQRPFAGLTADYYTFDPSVTALPVLAASGSGPVYGYHGGQTRTGGNLYFVAVDAATCICNAGVHGTINGIPFVKDCLPEPTGDLLAQKNPTCFADTYQAPLLLFCRLGPSIRIYFLFKSRGGQTHIFLYRQSQLCNLKESLLSCISITFSKNLARHANAYLHIRNHNFLSEVRNYSSTILKNMLLRNSISASTIAIFFSRLQLQDATLSAYPHFCS